MTRGTAKGHSGTLSCRGAERRSIRGVSKQYYVYILSNATHRLYVGVTNDLLRRVYQHKNKLVPGFTARYNITWLMYFEETTDVMAAIAREKELKGWSRNKKTELIESMNPQWKDLSAEWFSTP